MNGIPDSIAFSSSTLDGQGNVIVTTNTVISGQQANLLVMKYDREGNLLWQDNYNGAYNGRDYGVAITTDNANNIYVAAATQTSLISSSYLVRKYGATGNLLWSTTYSGSGSFNTPTAIAIDNNGNAYVTGVAYSFYSQMDYATLKYDANGVQKWVQTYNYANLYDVPAGIEINNATNSVYVTGASASASNNYDYATVEYSTINGIQLNVNRVTAAGAGFDKATAIQRDNVGNIYITGMAFETSSNSYDIKTIKLNANLQVQWVQTFDKEGLEDAAMALEVDNLGNVCVGGYVNTTNEGKNAILLKYDANGSLLWKREYNNNVENGNEEVAKIAIDAQGNVWFAGVSDKGQETDVLTIKYDVNGNLKTLKMYEYAANGTDEASDIKLTNSGEVYISAKVFDGANYKNGLIKYSTFENPLNVVYDTLGNPLYGEGQIIIKFRPEVVNLDFVNNRDKVFEIVPNVINDSARIAIESKLGISLDKSKIQKIFTRMTTADSISISRLGANIRLNPLWSAFLVTLPNGINIEIFSDSVSSLTNFIEFAHPNWVGKQQSVPNDSYYSDQTGLQSLGFSTAHINIEDAWNIQTGQDYVKVGICDDPIFWANEDFGDGTFNGSKIIGGWDFATNTHISNITNPLADHGTGCAGIIGALRNNGLGISGIAGGDVNGNGNNGVQLFSLGLLHDGGWITTQIASNAIVEGSTQTTNGFGYGLHILSNSWGINVNSPGIIQNDIAILSEAVKTAWRNECTVVASRGNLNNQILNYPSTYKDDWVICVGASGTDGLRKNHSNGDNQGCLSSWGSSFGNGVDVIAPGITDLIVTTHQPSISNGCFSYSDNNYQTFNGTSAAAPHVAGVAALMLSEHNINNGYPNNLSPDDVEELIQIYAADRDGGGTFPNGYDIEQGWGLLDAKNVMEHLNMPSYRVLHSTMPLSTSQSSPSNLTTIFLADAVNGVSVGYYSAQRVDVVQNYFVALPTPTTQIMNSWIRPSSIIGTSNSVTIEDKAFADLSMTAVPGGITATATTSFWHIISTISGQPVNQWIPSDPSQAKSAFSLHLYQPTTTEIEQEFTNDVSVYPNPFSDIVNINYDVFEEDNLQLVIADMAGKIVYTQIIDNKQNSSTSVNLKELSSGIYVCKIMGGKQECVKMVAKM